MSKFNDIRKTETRTNYMGEKANVYPDKLRLALTTLNTFLDGSYYEAPDKIFKNMKVLTDSVDPLFIAKLAVYARNEFNMRSVSHLLAYLLADKAKGEEWKRMFYNKVIVRPDDMTEIATLILKEGKLPNSIKRGFVDAFNKFDDYQIAKYKQTKKTVSLKDIVKLVHPSPNSNNEKSLKGLIDGTLKNTDTWESGKTEATKYGTKEEKSVRIDDMWYDMVSKKKLGAFAMVRNLRKILVESPRSIPLIVRALTNITFIKGSKMLPFRFLSAYEAVSGMTDSINKAIKFESDSKVLGKEEILSALEVAVTFSVNNLPDLPGKTVILTDNSGSMTGDIGGSSAVSAMSKTSTANIANLFGLMYWLKTKNTYFAIFGDELWPIKLDRDKGLFDNYKEVSMLSNRMPSGTEHGIFTFFEEAIKEHTMFDRVIIFSDQQIGSEAWYGTSSSRAGKTFNALFNKYREINPSFKAYSVDLRNYGDTVFDGSVIKLGGWSERIFDILKFAETDPNALIHDIEAISFDTDQNKN